MGKIYFYIKSLFSGRVANDEFAQSYFLFIFPVFLAPVLLSFVVPAIINPEINIFSQYLLIICFSLSSFVLVSVSVRRLHDLNFTGFAFIVVAAVPILLIWLLVKKGSQGTNLYGSPPQERSLWRVIFNPA